MQDLIKQKCRAVTLPSTRAGGCAVTLKWTTRAHKASYLRGDKFSTSTAPRELHAIRPAEENPKARDALSEPNARTCEHPLHDHRLRAARTLWRYHSQRFHSVSSLDKLNGIPKSVSSNNISGLCSRVSSAA